MEEVERCSLDALGKLYKAHDEVRAAVPAVLGLRRAEPQPGLVDQRRGLQRVPRALTAHVVMGQAMEFGGYERDEPAEGSLVPVRPRQEKLCNLLRLRVAHVVSIRWPDAVRRRRL